MLKKEEVLRKKDYWLGEYRRRRSYPCSAWKSLVFNFGHKSPRPPIIMLAIRGGNIQVVERLVAGKRRLFDNIKSFPWGSSHFEEAALAGHPQMLQWLFDQTYVFRPTLSNC